MTKSTARRQRTIKPHSEASGAQPTSKPARNAGGKLGAVIALLRRDQGASLDDLMQATGWQAHSVRGAIAGAIKVKRGLTVLSEKTDAGRVYRIVEPAA
jgi:hypothetical protein